MTRIAQRFRRGFTLVELILSMAVMAVLLGGISSAMILAGRAVPDRDTPLKDLTEGFHAAQRLAGELFAAQTITSRSAAVVEFTVADRSGDNVAESIRYAWGGVAGQPLTRQYNSGSVVSLLEDIHQFELRYDIRNVSGQDRVTVVHMTIRRGADPSSRVDTSVQLLNQPL